MRQVDLVDFAYIETIIRCVRVCRLIAYLQYIFTRNDMCKVRASRCTLCVCVFRAGVMGMFSREWIFKYERICVGLAQISRRIGEHDYLTFDISSDTIFVLMNRCLIHVWCSSTTAEPPVKIRSTRNYNHIRTLKVTDEANIYYMDI